MPWGPRGLLILAIGYQVFLSLCGCWELFSAWLPGSHSAHRTEHLTRLRLAPGASQDPFLHCCHPSESLPASPNPLSLPDPISAHLTSSVKPLCSALSCLSEESWAGVGLTSLCPPPTPTALCHMLCAQSLQSCPALCNPMDCRPPGSSVLGILQERILERVRVPSSR